MNIAAELSNERLTIFMEGLTWQSLTSLFGEEDVKVKRILYMEDEPVFHDTITTSTGEPETHTRLAFCGDALSIDELKRKLTQAGFAEPYDITLSGNTGHFNIDKMFADAYAISFSDFQNNLLFLRWLIQTIPSLEADTFVKKLLSGGRYNSRAFAEFSAFADLNRFMEYRCSLWMAAVVKEYEVALLAGTACCAVCTPMQVK